MKRIRLYALLPFIPLLALLGTSSADRPPPSSRGPSSVTLCFPLIDQPCSFEGAVVRCFNRFPDEPGLCRCSQGTWHCG
jgi:hypothetical protein